MFEKFFLEISLLRLTGQPFGLNEDETETIFEANRHVAAQKVAEKLNVAHTAIEKHLNRIGFLKKLDIFGFRTS